MAVGIGTPFTGGFSVTVPSCVRHGQGEWVLIPKQGFTIAVSRSGGAAFSTRAILTTAASHAQLSVLPDETIDVTYYDARASTVVSLMHARLGPNTNTFSTPEAIRTGPHFQSNAYLLDGIGDYIGLIPGYGTFTDNSGTRSRISFFRLP